MSIPIVTFIGKSGAGKTTFIEKLVVEMKSRNYRIATIKHHPHLGFDFDVPGKDSWRFAEAGSDIVIVASPDKIASHKKLERELSLEEIIPMVSDVDLILAEEYHKIHLPSIEIIRFGHYAKLRSDEDDLIAIVSDMEFDIAVPHFPNDDITGIANFLESWLLNGNALPISIQSEQSSPIADLITMG